MDQSENAFGGFTGEFQWREIGEWKYMKAYVPLLTRDILILDAGDTNVRYNNYDNSYIAISVPSTDRGYALRDGRRVLWLVFYRPGPGEVKKALLETPLVEMMKDMVVLRYGAGI
jgi:hypothetical protein